MSTFQQLDRQFPWSFLGFVAAIVFGGLGIYSYLSSSRAPSLILEIVKASPVFDVREDVPTLEIVFDGKNIRESHQSLTLLNARLSNNGDMAIKAADFDTKDPLRIDVVDGILINADLMQQSEYMVKVFASTTIDSVGLTLPPFIVEPGAPLSLKLLVLHDETTEPSIAISGTVANIKAIEVVQRFGSDVVGNLALGGSSRTQLFRVLVYGGGMIVILGIIVALASIVRGRVYEFRRESKRKTNMDILGYWLSSQPPSVRKNLRPFANLIANIGVNQSYYLYRELLQEPEELLHESRVFQRLVMEAQIYEHGFDPMGFRPDDGFLDQFGEMIQIIA